MSELTVRNIPLDAVLCYVDGGSAYFTTQPLSKQWGDDWNDAPYEHNAGRPYLPFKEPDGRTWEIVRVGYECDLETPAEKANGNSWLSVEQINAGAAAWLTSGSWSTHKTVIPAGTSVRDFVQIIHSIGGTVYMPVEVAHPARA